MFDFDLEVEPILQVLIGKALESARIEVLEVEEVRNLGEFKKNFK
jgi:radial spoke head protein 3